MLTGFASMRLPPVEDIVLGPPGDGAPRRCSGTCAQGIVIVSRGFVHRLQLAGTRLGRHMAPTAATCPQPGESPHLHLGKRLAPQNHAALSTTLRNGSPAANRRALSNK